MVMMMMMMMMIITIVATQRPLTGVSGPSGPETQKSLKQSFGGSAKKVSQNTPSKKCPKKSETIILFAFVGYFRGLGQTSQKTLSVIFCDFWPGGPRDSRKWTLSSQNNNEMRRKGGREGGRGRAAEEVGRNEEDTFKLGPAKTYSFGSLRRTASARAPTRKASRGTGAIIKTGFVQLKGARVLLQGPRLSLQGHRFHLQALSSP